MAFQSTVRNTRGGIDWDNILTDDTPLEREKALEEIKGLMGAEFHGWFNDVHRLRSAGKQADYEDAIYKKLEELTTDKNSTNKELFQ